MARKLSIVLLMMVAIALVTGCSKDPSSPQTVQTPNLNSPDGGYTAANEQPAFGDPALQSAGADEVAYNDPISSVPSVDSMMKDNNAGWYHFRALWGHLRVDTAEQNWTDWSGKLEISHGALVLRRVIRFEDGDYILPRTDRKVIEWVSKTRPHSDGIAVDIFVPRPRPILDTTVDTVTHIDSTVVVDTLGDTTYVVDTVNVPVIVVDTTFPPADAQLTFTTPPYTRTFSLAELAKLDTMVTLADSNQVAFWGTHFERQACPRGFLAGNWQEPDSTGMGHFRGMWIDRFSQVSGFLEGTYGVNSSGRSVFFGKWIDQTGQFQGFLSGTYGVLPKTRNNPFFMGLFAGFVLDSQNNKIGVLGGRFVGAEFLDKGFFEGRWKINCNLDHSPGDRGNHEDDGMPE